MHVKGSADKSRSRYTKTTPKEYNLIMLTVIETPLFGKLWPAYWSEDERGTFAAFMAEHPDEGDVVQGSDSVRKVRWSRVGSGKSGGVRVIYFVYGLCRLSVMRGVD